MRRRVSVLVSSTPGPRRDTIIAASKPPQPVAQPRRGREVVRSQTGPLVALSATARRPLPLGRAAARSQTGRLAARAPAGRRPLPRAQCRLLALRRSIREMGRRLALPRPEGSPAASRWEASPEDVPRAEAIMAAAARPAQVGVVASAVAADGIVEGRLMRTSDTRPSALRLSASALVASIALATMAFAAETVAQKTFPSAEAAVTAVVDDLRSENLSDLMAILGPGAERLLDSGDPVADRRGRERFVASYDDAHHLEETQNGAVLFVGKEDWPVPIPLRKVVDLWSFDTKAGEQQMIDRRIGRNELDTIQTMLAYVDAQQDYADWTRQQTGTAAYAQRILSRPGMRDGLYWPAAEGEPESPMGPLVAEAQEQGYRRSATPHGRLPYHGYFFKVLTGQGNNAPGGAADYIVRGKMIGGYGLVAWPARYGDSGVMTFIVNHDATVYQQNLGPNTAALAEVMTRYDPDPSWQKVEL